MIKRGKRFLRVLIVFALALCVASTPISAFEAEAAGQISSRLTQVKKDFPNKSKINKVIWVTTVVKSYGSLKDFTAGNEGCNALVAYATMKIFHNPYIPDASGYKKIGTAKTSSIKAMKKLFKKAKKGDVIRWHRGGEDYHFAIYLSRYQGGVKVYEANFGPKNKVWYNHKWPYRSMKSWSGGGTKVSVYRSSNYNQVNKGKAALNLKKGQTFTYDGITYQVTKTGIRKGKVKVIQKTPDAGSVPKAIGINYDTANRLRSYWKTEWPDIEFSEDGQGRIIAYRSNAGRYQNEQYFVVQ